MAETSEADQAHQRKNDTKPDFIKDIFELFKVENLQTNATGVTHHEKNSITSGTTNSSFCVWVYECVHIHMHLVVYIQI